MAAAHKQGGAQAQARVFEDGMWGDAVRVASLPGGIVDRRDSVLRRRALTRGGGAAAYAKGMIGVMSRLVREQVPLACLPMLPLPCVPWPDDARLPLLAR